MDTTTIDRATATQALVVAVTDAARAPSIHNTQPWRWRVQAGVADLYADPSRHLHIIDPDRRLLMLSCGAALHQAYVALAAAGIASDVTRLADADDVGTDADDGAGSTSGVPDRDRLATITVTGRSAATEATVRMHQLAQIRHSDRRPLLDEPIPATVITALRETAAPFGIGLHPLTGDQVIELAVVASRAQDAEVDEAPGRAELDAWTAYRPAGAGVPDANIPDRSVPTTVPMRDFGHLGTLAVPGGHDNAATYVILYGRGDQPRSWLRAGEALSAIWLTALGHGIALLPMSAAVETPAARRRLHRVLSGVGDPYLVLRLGLADPDLPAVAGTPRLPADVTVEVLS